MMRQDTSTQSFAPTVSCHVEDLYYTHDALKNTTALFGIQAGRRALYEYGPYGSILKREGNAAEDNPFRFSSEYADDELGLVYYNYRYYNAMDGRWINRDPMGEQGGLNLYAFVKNIITARWDNLGMVSCSALDPQFGHPFPCSLPKTEGWSESWLDFARWVLAIHPATTTHEENSEQSLLVKNSSVGKKLMDSFIKKNKNSKKCWEWEEYTNAKLVFGEKEFIEDLPNGRAHFVGSGRGDVSIEVDLKSSKIIAHFQVENVTSLTSFLYKEGPEIKYPGPFGNWKQLYKWSVEYPCCLKDMPEDVKIQYEIKDILENTFPYNLPDHFQPTSICLPF